MDIIGDCEAKTSHRELSDHSDLLGVGTWAPGTQSTSEKRPAHGSTEKSSARKKDKMSASLVRWVDNSQDDPWSHVAGGKSGKPAGDVVGKRSGA